MPEFAISGEYVINPGDTITILVWGHEEYTQTISVRPDGRISYPFLGEFQVDGLTTTELSEKIKQELLKHLVDPQVTVAITQPKKNEVFVLGQVENPNQIRFDQDKLSLLKALSMAGGILYDKADLHNVRIIRDDGTSEIIDLQILLNSEPHQAILLLPGDVVFIPSLEYVKVAGHVMRPGEYRTNSDLSVTQAIALAGGPIQDTADLANSSIIRSNGEVANVKLSIDLKVDDDQTEDLRLYPGDTLYIPGIYEADEINVVGYVQKPGRYKVKRQVNLFEALAFSGGITNTNETELKKVYIIRADFKIEKIDLSILREPGPESLATLGSIMLSTGDTLVIPQKRKGVNWSWSLAFTILSVITLVYNLTNDILK